jgi:hypothetical protein
MTKMTNRQKAAIAAYFTALDNCKKVATLKMGDNVDEAAQAVAYDAAFAVGVAFGVKGDSPMDAVMEALWFARPRPADTASVAIAMREIALASKSEKRWAVSGWWRLIEARAAA